MRDTSFSDSLRDFIWSRRPIFWVACAVGGVLLVFAALLWTRYELVRIDYALSAPLKAGTATAREYSYEGGVDRSRRSGRSSGSRWCRAAPTTSSPPAATPRPWSR